MSGALTTGKSTRTATRYAALGIGLVGAAGAALALTLLLWDRAAQTARADVENYHLRSASLASGLTADLAGVRNGIRGLASPDIAPVDAVLELSTSLAAARVATEQLGALQQAARETGVGPTFQAVLERLDRLAAAVENSELYEKDGGFDGTYVALDSLSLAVEQLRRLHVMAARQHVAEMASAFDQRNRTVTLLAALFAVGVIAIGAPILGRLRRTLSREEELRSSLERARRNQQRAVKMDALSRLAGGVAHDFNNLLTVMLGHSEQIQGSLDRDSPLHLEAEGIQHAVGQAATLAKQLLTFSRSAPSKPKLIDLNELTREMELLLSRLLGEHCSLVTTLASDLGAVRADPREIERVLINLVSNAGDAMPNGGTVTIETMNSQGKRESASGSQADGRETVRLSVCDMGTGMDDETQDRVFEPFFTTKSEHEGTGLGLPTVHGIVTKAGGWVEIESEMEIGTRVDIYLPRQASEPEDNISPEHPDRGPSSETILLVDDDARIRRSCARTLQEAGYMVLESPDGAAALELCRGHRERLDLILTDVRMPGLTGPELVDRAKFLHPEAHVLFMSGYTNGELRAGRQFLVKPFGRGELLSQVRASLSS